MAVKKIIIVFLVMWLQSGFAQVGVNILSPHPSAAMQVESPTGSAKGLLTPSMTTINRISISNNTLTPADGLIVYDINHKMHYYFQSTTNKWISMSPLSLSTTSISTVALPIGNITTPASGGPFALGINTQNPSQALHVVGNMTVSGNISGGASINAQGTVNAGSINTPSINITGFPVNSMVPAGAIIMWSGTVIPMGWALCDGTTYGSIISPDLRGRFVIGVNNTPTVQVIATGQYLMFANLNQGITPATAPADGTTLNYGKIGNTGGESGHTITLAESASHTHSVSATVNNGSFLGFNSGSNWIGNGSSMSGDSYAPTVAITQTSQGGNQVHENRPPYYVLAYIIKLN